jgi:hypothetical protein
MKENRKKKKIYMVEREKKRFVEDERRYNKKREAHLTKREERASLKPKRRGDE